MDITGIIKAINEAHQKLNTTIDSEFKARRHQTLRGLDLAAKALLLAEGHVKKAEATVAKLQSKVAGTDAAAPAAK